ncbi:MAG: hypothetical protein KF896_03370 [Ignavibacteriae bacterium]|nr:hypothetical protein [Ignavibacteriota bacterium]
MKFLNIFIFVCSFICGIVSTTFLARCCDYEIRQEYMGEIEIMEQFKKDGKHPYRFDDKISVDIQKYNTVEDILSLIKKSEEIESVIIGIKVEENVPTNRIHSITVECAGDNVNSNIYVLILSSEIEGEKTEKIKNRYKFIDEKVIKKNYNRVLKEKIKRVYQYQRSKLWKPVPVSDTK